MKKLRITFNAPVVLIFVFVCLVATLLGEMTGGYLTRLLFMTYHSSLTGPLTYLRFFTHVLGHDGWTHFVGNAAYILLLGPVLEEKYDSRTLAGIIVLTALATGFANFLLFRNVALCGASGVVFAFIVLSSVTDFKEGEIPLTFILVALIYIGREIINGIFVTDNISNLSHIIGGVIGAAVGFRPGILKRR